MPFPPPPSGGSGTIKKITSADATRLSVTNPTGPTVALTPKVPSLVAGTNIAIATTAGKDKVSLDTAAGIVLKGSNTTAGGIGYAAALHQFQLEGTNIATSLVLYPTAIATRKRRISFGGTSAMEAYTAIGNVCFELTALGIVILKSGGGTDTAACAVASTPAVVSGTAFQPNANLDSTVYIQTNAAVAGTVTITMGPAAAGTTHVVANTVKQVAASDLVTTLHVPAGWHVVVTVVTLHITHVLVVTC